ncbi:protein tramtrack, beta isoform-like isoform X3 [Cylas formicarius]|uniref:protein tramtrack, beta isoform-like isoform X3 n=1 Tax=Cylas formicarius TaxID=197179 RepID=UPI002958BCAE|nr:protein tramtrack, beta isoform-like isoform X3 [Cylas formicarius]
MASEQFSLCWDNFHKNMSSGMNSLLENEDLVDVTLAVEGKCLKAHKMVLSVCSPYFKELFKSNPCQHPIVFMKDVSYVAISDLLQFMYQGEVQVSQENLTTFIKTAEALQIKGLTGDGNGSVDNDESVHEKSTPAPEDTYKPVPRPKKQPPTPVVSSTPAPKRQRLSDSQPTPSAVVTKTEPVNSSSAETPPVQFKVEPYDQNQTLTIPDDDGDNFGDDTLDDNTADDTEDYSMMEGEEPQAGTSTDGAGEGQGVIYFTAGRKYPLMILEDYEYKLKTRNANKSLWRCTQEAKYRCKAKAMTFGKTVRIKSSVGHTHSATFTGNRDNLMSQQVTIEYCTVFFLPGKKHPRMVLDGYEFNIAKKLVASSIWRCVRESKRCKSRLKSFGKTVQVKASHNHPPTFIGSYSNLKSQIVALEYTDS